MAAVSVIREKPRVCTVSTADRDENTCGKPLYKVGACYSKVLHKLKTRAFFLSQAGTRTTLRVLTGLPCGVHPPQL